MEMEKSNGPRTKPLGTPYLRDRTSDVGAFTCTVCCLSVRNDASRVCVSGDSLFTADFRKRRSWSITSKALAKSTKRAPQNLLSFILESHWSTRLVKAVLQE